MVWFWACSIKGKLTSAPLSECFCHCAGISIEHKRNLGIDQNIIGWRKSTFFVWEAGFKVLEQLWVWCRRIELSWSTVKGVLNIWLNKEDLNPFLWGFNIGWELKRNFSFKNYAMRDNQGFLFIDTKSYDNEFAYTKFLLLDNQLFIR